ncbi:hypothetical protein VST7929_02578 [Vibrio stylophorae]|uniref:Transcription factor zinc-finger domain-containing protein n=1 Tax=Vibrio stylophorae TaxID=659351 RepID=A0ABM8ZWA3_9VIBR|nr:zf-TFIIB domain-containing protein [Vibrio stylophorae]CAH0534628.1 hypothetical protein VST7929_02578 [Vibrio stylophorae]
MKCPACSHQMSHVEVGGVEVDVCRGGCGGIWFDTYEFKKFDEPHEEAGTSLLNIEVNPEIKVDHSARRHCPKCENQPLHRHFYSMKREVEIDDCVRCAGVFLDTGELNIIRGMYNTEEEKREANVEAINEMFNEDVMNMNAKHQENREKAQRFANMVRFLCPSAYIEGKQKWGAF